MHRSYKPPNYLWDPLKLLAHAWHCTMLGLLSKLISQATTRRLVSSAAGDRQDLLTPSERQTALRAAQEADGFRHPGKIAAHTNDPQCEQEALKAMQKILGVQVLRLHAAFAMCVFLVEGMRKRETEALSVTLGGVEDYSNFRQVCLSRLAQRLLLCFVQSRCAASTLHKWCMERTMGLLSPLYISIYSYMLKRWLTLRFASLRFVASAHVVAKFRSEDRPKGVEDIPAPATEARLPRSIRPVQPGRKVATLAALGRRKQIYPIHLASASWSWLTGGPVKMQDTSCPMYRQRITRCSSAGGSTKKVDPNHMPCGLSKGCSPGDYHGSLEDCPPRRLTGFFMVFHLRCFFGGRQLVV